MHLRTHVAAEHRSPPGLTARTEYADGMIEHDGHVGTLLKELDDLGIADNTIVLYTTDNGPHMNTWPDGAMTPFRSEKNTNWEGAFRVPCMIRWPGKIKAGSVSNEIVSGHDWCPTLLAAAGDPDVKEKLLKGHEAAGKTFKVHLDGYNQLPYLTGQAGQEPAAGLLLLQRRRRPRRPALRELEARVPGAAGPGHPAGWAEPFTPLRVPKFFDLRADPYERADVTSNTYYDWRLEPVPHPVRRPGRRRPSSWRRSRSSHPPAGGQLHHRPGDGEVEAWPWRRLRRSNSGLGTAPGPPSRPSQLGDDTMRTRTTLAAVALLVAGALLSSLAIPTTAQEKKTQPGAKSEPAFTPTQLDRYPIEVIPPQQIPKT